MFGDEATMTTDLPPTLSAGELRVTGLKKSFGGIAALQGVDLCLPPGSLTALVGPNGSGKTTFIDCLTAFQRADAGSVLLAGRDLSKLSARARIKAGIRRTFQAARTFAGISAIDHLLLAQQEHDNIGWFEQVLRSKRLRHSQCEHLERGREMLAVVELDTHRDTAADQLSYGQQKLLGLACALIARPRVLCLDEPLAGVSPRLTDLLVRVLNDVKAHGTSILLIEHNIDFVHAVSDQVTVMAAGSVLANGPPTLLNDDPRVFETLMGGASET
jgi:neutral amino acid transport system ATP-binding protein